MSIIYTKKHILMCTLVLLIAVLFFLYGVAQADDETTKLQNFFSKETRSREALDKAKREIPRICLEVGDKAIPVLSGIVQLDRLTPTTVDRAEIALKCLVYIGGPNVAKLFKEMYEETKNESFRDMMRETLCEVLQSTGAPEDVQFLIKSLEGPLIGPGSFISSTAAYALAVLKPQSAKSALEKRVAEYKLQNLENAEVRLALDRINGMEWQTPQAASVKGEDAIILTIFRFGIPFPEMNMMNTFIESERNRIWKRENRAWRFEHAPDIRGKTDPSISFRVFITKDGKRALCSVGIFCGRVCGYGFDYILKKEKEDWRVIGLFPTWIS